MIEKIRQYFIDYFAQLNPNGPVGVDYLGDEPVSYAIEGGIADPWLVHYVDGGGIKQYNFMMTSREYFGSDVYENMENLKFYEYIAEQIEKNNDLKRFPNIAGTYKVEVLTNGYIIESGSDSARYQIQLRLLYTV